MTTRLNSGNVVSSFLKKEVNFRMFEVKKKEHESLDSLLRRFHRKVQQSGVLVQAKKVRFYERPKSKQRRRDEAIRRTELRKERDVLKKLGKLEERTREHYGSY